MLARKPERVLELAVRGMLPRNRLSRQRLRHMKVYAGPEHPHVAQVNASRKRKRAPLATPLAAITGAQETETSA